jgi:murein DD-endopeptidase MepM/ murein hydrolase activator NlpD
MEARTRRSFILVMTVALGPALASPRNPMRTPWGGEPPGVRGEDLLPPDSDGGAPGRMGLPPDPNTPGGRQDGPRRRSGQEPRVFRFDRDALLRRDFDRDGVPNSTDPCWLSRPGEGTSVPGCTRLDVSQMPEPLARRLPAAIETALHDLKDDQEVREIAAAVRNLSRTEEEAVARIRSGDICEGARGYALLRLEFESIAGMFDPLLRTAASAITEPGDLQGDVRGVEQRVSELEFLQAMVGEAAGASRELADAVQEICDLSSPGLATRGTVQKVDDSTRRVFLRDGRTFAWVVDAELGAFSMGQQVTIEGIDLGDSTGLATRISPEITFPVDPVNVLPCLKPVVAPIQPFPPVSFGPFVLNDLIAHEYPSFFPGIPQIYRLEEGMRIGAERTCPGGGGWILNGRRHSMEVKISYVSDSDESKTTTLSKDLTPFSTPVALPTDVDPSFPALLTVIHNVQQCHIDPFMFLECGPKKPTFTFTYDLHVVDRGSMCQSFYEETLFNVDDRLPGQFKPARLDFIFSLAVGDGGTPPTFVAQGYSSSPSGGSSYPFVYAINNQAHFAIHSHDFYPIHGADSPGEAVLLRAATGVSHAAGLMWPRAVGIRNGRGYRYSCNLPSIVRDVVGFCPNKPVDAYYHMPFANNVTSWVQSQGNQSDPGCMGEGCPTHANAYAYDMKVPCNNEIRAARGGRVVKVKENQQAQVQKWCCAGQPECAGCSPICCTISGASCPHNELWIRHQDDSVGRYVHMPMNGVLVNQNDVVRRGQLVGLIGNTGNSSGPHLHFEENTGQTHLALFVAKDPSTSAVLSCYEPLEDQALRSFNQECTSCPPQ